MNNKVKRREAAAFGKDYRKAGMAEGAVRQALLGDLEAQLEARKHAAKGTRASTQWRQYAYVFGRRGETESK